MEILLYYMINNIIDGDIIFRLNRGVKFYRGIYEEITNKT